MNAVREPLTIDLLPELGLAIRALQSMRNNLDDLLRDFDEVLIEVVRCRDDERREQLLAMLGTIARVRGVHAGFNENLVTAKLLGEVRGAVRARRDWRTRAARIHAEIDRALGVT